MRLASIEVDGLFGMFDHRLPLSKDRVSIVIAPNGYGKSRLLGIAHAMMALDLATLLETDFSQARLVMNNGSRLTTIREISRDGVTIRFEFEWHGKVGSFDTALLLADMDESDCKLRAAVKELVRLDEGGQVPKYLHRIHGTEMSFVQALLHYRDRLNDDLEGRLPPSDLIELTDSLPVIRVSTQRTLQHECACPMDGEPGLLYPYIFTPTVRDMSEEISKIVKQLVVEGDDPLALRLRALLEIMNSMLLFKQILVDDRGFRVEMENGRLLSVEDLSAGEQQLLIMVFSLMFRTLPGSVAIIDEPEISLHVAWQQRMVPILLDIANIMNIQVILATHSPQIVHDRWDLTVQLGG